MNDRKRSGQAMIEATIVMALLALVLFAALQISLLYSSESIVGHAATSVARAEAVGFNDFMTRKVARVATIPIAGPMETPNIQTSSANPQTWLNTSPGGLLDDAIRNAPPASPQTQIELSRIPLYLAAGYGSELPSILEYRDWDNLSSPSISQAGENQIRSRLVHRMPLIMPMHRAFYRGDDVFLEGEVTMDDHADVYLE